MPGQGPVYLWTHADPWDPLGCISNHVVVVPAGGFFEIPPGGCLFAAIKNLQKQYDSHVNDVGMAFNEHDRLKTLLGALKDEQAAYEAKDATLGPNDFDGTE